MSEVEEFAARVRGLKVRDGRSYEALGRRLGVSASTLHRYCSGVAVPESFAVVERLARLCGAAADEVRELEERWRHADLVRRPPASPPEPVEPTDSGGPAGSAEPAGPPERAGSAEPAAPVVAVVPAPAPSLPRRKAWFVVGAVAGLAALALVLGNVLLPDGRDREPRARPTPQTKTSAPRAETAPPFTYTVSSDLWENGCGHTYLADRPPTRVPAPPVPADAGRWAGALGAVDGGQTLVRLSVQGKGASAVVLQGLHVRVVGRAGPLLWAAYRMDEGCGGAVTPRHFAVDLDAPRPLARPVGGYDASGEEGREIPAVRFPYAVTAAEPEELLVSARAAHCDCRWYLELEWSSEGRSGVARIADPGGAAFRTSGRAKGGPVHAYDPSKGLWITGTEAGQGG
ncbi:helix-turn-helix domain-containing protein [Streptomyces litmocidini]|uniref:helix-turn-helix domain-containing protein n=1 Tax=Streptomyces litmocidini TaxID=67318 RepID=UPI0036F916C9